MDIGLKDKVVLITGAAGMIGRQMAVLFAQEGARIVIAGRSTGKEASDTAELVESAGGKAIIEHVDVADIAKVKGLVNRVAERWGGADILINNAAPPMGGRTTFEFTTGPLDRWNEMITVVLTGYFLLSREVFPYMQQKGWGRIVNIGSTIGLFGLKGSVHYSTAKAGLIGLTKTAAKEMAPHGILVNAVAPALVLRPPENVPAKSQFRSALEEAEAKASPIGRVIVPDDVARTVLFLASAWNTAVNGQVLAIDGGRF